jgi:hypothetical protein
MKLRSADSALWSLTHGCGDVRQGIVRRVAPRPTLPRFGRPACRYKASRGRRPSRGPRGARHGHVQGLCLRTRTQRGGGLPHYSSMSRTGHLLAGTGITVALRAARAQVRPAHGGVHTAWRRIQTRNSRRSSTDSPSASRASSGQLSPQRRPRSTSGLARYAATGTGSPCTRPATARRLRTQPGRSPQPRQLTIRSPSSQTVCPIANGVAAQRDQTGVPGLRLPPPRCLGHLGQAVTQRRMTMPC